MSSPQYANLFSDQAASYRAFRPVYPDQLYQIVLDYAQLPTHECAIDVATGQGQAAVRLAQQFTRVLAYDGNSKQLEHVQAAPNVTYAVCDAHELPVADSSADLVTVAQALHWFDIPRFFAEARRVLRPHGTLAAWTYDLPDLNGPESALTAVLRKMYGDTLGPYWADRVLLVKQRYKGLEPDKSVFATSELRTITIDFEFTLAAVVGNVSSWSSYNTYRKQHPNLPDPLTAFQESLLQAAGTTDLQHKVTVSWPITILLAKHPVKE